MPPRLKSLELHGYKTFAVISEFEFPGMVTAVVGPNGSGKSNIADALRWVLGEQSYSLLRGKKTEDMIFAGSEQRPRAGMASASITFDNSDGWLPIDFSEVSITRRAYRDGENEYLLNGQRVRLRDISELLAQSGLAERTYTIIGQGLVDAALALKPEERRRLFEEAAGIGLYRSRKEEAINRMEVTRRNLDRVKDILAELEPRLQSLEKQARRVMDYERIKADLRLLLRDWYGYYWHHSQLEVKRTREVLRGQETRLEETRNHLHECGDQLARVRSQILGLRTQLNDWYSQSADSHNQLEKVSRTLAVLDERQRALQEQEIIVQEDLNRLEGEWQDMTMLLEKANSEKGRLQTEFEEANSQIDLARQALQIRQNERSRIEKQLRDTRQALVSSETQQVQSKARQDELNNRLQTQKLEDEKFGNLIESTRQGLVGIRIGLETSNQNLRVVELEVQTAEARLREIQKGSLLLEDRRKTQLKERSAFEAERARIRAQLDVIIEAEKSFTGYSEGTRFLHQSFIQGRLTGDHFALGNLLQVPAEFETAITAALGEYLDLIVLDKSIDPENVIHFLENNGKGKVVILPVQWIVQASQENKALEDDDCLGRAVDLVKFGEGYQPIVESILGQVWIVRNRNAAKRLLRGMPVTARMVTLQGEVFSAQGPVFLGQGLRSGIITRPRQKNELNQTDQQFENQINIINHSLQQMDEELANLRGQEDSFIKANRKLQEKLDFVKKENSKQSLLIDQANMQLEWLMNQRASLEKEMVKTRNELDKLTVTLSEKVKEIKTLSDQILHLQNTLGGLSMEEYFQEVNRWETEKAVIARALRDAQQRVGERQQSITKNQQQKSGLEKRLNEILHGKESIEKSKVETKGQETIIAERIQNLQNLILPSQQTLNEAEKNADELLAIETVAQQAYTGAERHHSQAQLEMTRQRDALETLRHRIEEDFGLVAFEYAETESGPTPLPFEGMVEQLPDIKELAPGLEENISRQKTQLRRIGAINPDALNEYKSVQERHHFMTTQVTDLNKAEVDLRQVITELDALMKRDFRKTFNAVASEFHQMFGRLFEGGSARLVLDDEENLNETGIDIEARLPGKREQGLLLLSGGERSLTAAALVFALLKVSPTPFCVMDEVDAMLDEANVGRFCTLLSELSRVTQFIVITHNRNTVKMADVIYGITMGRDSTSQVISLKLDEITEEMVK
jgi:chromosome segregation protein